MRYLDVCAGISASTVAWKPLSWEAAAYSEIEAAPRAILAHHYPDTPLHGDFTTIGGDEYGAIDLLVGGTPCQDFSIAGLRAGLGGDRGNLSLQFLLLLARTRARWVVWENVPGVFSSLSHDAPDPCPPKIDLDGGDGPGDGEEIVVEDEYDADESHALGCFLAGLSELGYGVAYRVLDAQFAGVPQRRRRIFAVGYLGDWRRAAAVLLERHSLLGHPAPRRETGEGIARPIAAGSPRSSGYRNDADTADNLIAGTLPAAAARSRGAGTDPATIAATVSSKWAKGSGGPSGDECQNLLAVPQAFGGNNTRGPIDVSTALNSHGGPHGRLDFESETFVAQAFSIMPMNSGKDYVARPTDVAQPLMAGGPVGGNQGGDFIAHSLRGEGFDASEDGTGRGTPLVPVSFDCTAGGETGFAIGDVAGALRCGGHTNGHSAVAFTSKDHGQDVGDISPTLRAMEGDVANAGGQVAIAYGISADAIDRTGEGDGSPGQRAGLGISIDVATTLRTHGRDSVGTTSAVRRLTPRECERLQGFPDDYTLVPYRKGMMADGPRYKALGNSMAVPVMRWIGERIAMVDAL